MPLADVCHQESAQNLVQRALASARMPHAYILHGPDGVGKELFARRVAAVLLCEAPVTVAPGVRDACGACQSCHLVDADNHPDLHVVHRLLNAYHPDALVRNRKAIDLGVDVVRHFLIEAAGIAPSMGQAKVFIVREADAITPSAQNALLKTLEEPPPATFLFLLAASLDDLLPTTRSRCQLIGFGPLPSAFVAERLRARCPELPDADVKLCAALAQGSVAAALRFAEDELAAFHRTVSAALAGLTPPAASALAKQIVEYAKEAADRFRKRDPELSDTAAQRAALRDVFAVLAGWYRDRLHVAAGSPDLAAEAAGAAGFPLLSAAGAVKLIAETERQLDSNVNVQLCIESLVFKLAAVRELPAAALI
ncbi:MAG TPA: hypothetical protein P5572_13165 [Phycisphaerae bacterium]|nr:hypothetical protein [Phycisphaerae bacterium]